jgi:hypothetical protein
MAKRSPKAYGGLKSEPEPREIDNDMDDMSRRREGACTTGRDSEFLKEASKRNARGSAGLVDGIDNFPKPRMED